MRGPLSTYEADEQARLLDRAAAFAGRPRERIVALMDAEEAACRVGHCRSLPRRVVGDPSQDGQTTVGSDGGMHGCEKGVVSLLIDVILDAVRAGDLRFPEDHGPTEKALAACVLAMGIGMLMETAAAVDGLATDGFQAVRDAVDEFLDAQGWRPLSTEWDYDKTRDRVRAEILNGQWRQPSLA